MKNRINVRLLTALLFLLPFTMKAQDDLLAALEEEKQDQGVALTENTFKGTRLINGHTIEMREKGVLDFLITHRFGRVNTGIYDFFGLDFANIRLGLDYGITDRLNIGIGRSSFQKVYDGFLKYQLIRQQEGSGNMPFTVTVFGSAAVKTQRSPDPDVTIPFEQKLAYTAQVLVARKFGDRLSLQLMPSLVHRNFVDDPLDDNTIFALGAGGRVKISRRIALTGEYFYRFMGQDVADISNSLSLGIDIETGGHVFQLMFTNSRQMIEKGFITETDGQWGDGDIHFGFNISRVFYLSSGKKNHNW